MSYLTSVARAPVEAESRVSDGAALARESAAMEDVAIDVAPPGSSVPMAPTTPPQRAPRTGTATIFDSTAEPSPAVAGERASPLTSEPPARQLAAPARAATAEVVLQASPSPPASAPPDAPNPPLFSRASLDPVRSETSAALRIDETRVVVGETSHAGGPDRVDVGATPVVGSGVGSLKSDRPAPMRASAPTRGTVPRRSPGPTQVHIGAITLTVTASAPAPPHRPPPAAPIAPAATAFGPPPAPSREGLGFSASRHYLRWTGS